jgi:hypothetical protein
MAMDVTGLSQPQDLLLTRWGQLKAERATWLSHWRELSTYIQPRSGRFFVQDRDRGDRRHNSIINNTGCAAVRTLAAGMMGGMTSPARPWFRMGTADPDLAKVQSVKVWLTDVQKLMLQIFAKGNTYRALHSIYTELGVFGTAATILLPDFEDVVRHYPLTCGEYCIATDHRGQVTTLYREFQMPVHAVVGKWGKENCSQAVRNLFDRGSLDVWVTIIHAIEPRADRDTRYRDNKNMAWKSCYFEIGAEKGRYLSESGFKQFVGMCPRWITNGQDIYGESPGMEALGDIKALQLAELRYAQAVDKMTNPPLQVPIALKNQNLSMLPGGTTYMDMTGNNQIRNMLDIRLDLSHLQASIQAHQRRIDSTFYKDMFLLISQDGTLQMTAYEVAQRKEEKLTMVGPVVERLQNELLDPLVETTFARMLEAGIVPTPPPELQGQDIQVEFVSMMAQAQKAVGTNSIDRFVLNLGQIAQFKPGVLDKFDEDYWADAYADMTGVDPSLVVASEKVALIRQQKAQAAAAQQKMEMMQQGAGVAKDLAGTQTTQPSALTNVMDAFSGYNTPGAMQ